MGDPHIIGIKESDVFTLGMLNAHITSSRYSLIFLIKINQEDVNINPNQALVNPKSSHKRVIKVIGILQERKEISRKAIPEEMADETAEGIETGQEDLPYPKLLHSLLTRQNNHSKLFS